MSLRPAFTAPILIAFIAGFAAPSALADPKTSAVEAMLACRSVDVESERLACMDAAMNGLETAFPRAAMTPAQRTEHDEQIAVQEAETAVAAFGGEKFNNRKGDELKEINDVISVASTTHNKKALIILENGQIWRQLDADTTRVRIKKAEGKPVLIKRQMLGSHMMKIDGGRGFKVRRVK